MKRRFAVLLITGVLLVGQAAPLRAATRDTESARHEVRAFFVKAVKQVKKILTIIPADEYPTPPKPCTPSCP